MSFVSFGGHLARANPPEAEGVNFFEARIRPVLITHCYSCHSSQSETLQGGLRLDSHAGMLRGGDSGQSVIAPAAIDSLLIDAIRYNGLEMPPRGKLPDHVIRDFVKWIEMGAPDPRVGKTTRTGNGEPAQQILWSFRPLKRRGPPSVGDSHWPRTDIDRYVLARIQQNELEPVVDAEPHVLVRRLYFDLIGLPPTPEQLSSFIEQYSDSPQSAVRTLVDKLLQSDQFGERWARHWLDLVRYSETNGGDRNVIWPHAWRYRDYVIDSFNRDKPFDLFIREQIAGDLLPADSPEQRDEQLIATGMLTFGPKLFMETKAERFKMDVVDEQMDIVGRAVLGLTISCARCHDHKFDSISTEDYYALAGIFRSTSLLYGTAAPPGNKYGHDRPLQPVGKDNEKLVGPAAAWKKQVSDQTASRNKARSDRYRVFREKLAMENRLKLLAQQEPGTSHVEAHDLTAKIVALDEIVSDWDRKIEELDKQLARTVENPPPLPDYAMAVRDGPEPADCHVRIRGEFDRLGQPIPRGFLQRIPLQTSKIPADHSGRLQLADWLTNPHHPLTARVAVNRIWQHLFGEGLVRTLNNFGVTGERPSHPDLLDDLALTFQREGWSVKQLIRHMVLSRTYQLSSRHHAINESVDPENRLLWRMNRRRLDAEPLRDAILAVAGVLELQRPVGSAISREFAEERELNARVALSDEQLGGTHRSIYLPIARMSLPPMLSIWSFPDPSLIAGRRSTRTKADQQLFFLNSPLVVQHARQLAKRLLDAHPRDESRLQYCWQIMFARLPTASEQQLAFDYLNQLRNETDSDDVDNWARLSQALMASGEFRYLD